MNSALRHGFAATLAAGFLATSLSAQSNTFPFPASGSVGIGTTSPGYTLDVAGSFRAQGAFVVGGGVLDLANQDTSGGAFDTAGIKTWNTIRFYTTCPSYPFTSNANYSIELQPRDGSAVFKGKVGIGTASPGAPLDVVGGVRAQGLQLWGGGQLQVQWCNQADPTNQKFSELIQQNGQFVGRFVNDAYSAADSWLIARRKTNSYLVDTVTFPSGNVGIGTSTPVAKLTVDAGQGGWNTPAVTVQGAGDMRVRIVSSAVSGTLGGYDFQRANGAFLGGMYVSAGNGDLQWFTGSDGVKARVTVQDSTGNVGIGTTNPTNKLEVAGTIRAKEVIVETTGWSDYVFAPDYRLAPLSEVEAHIAAKGTLPGIPSAAEVATHGVSVGEMQAKLLAKIEELTLRQIAQEKRLDAQSAEIATLKAENTALMRSQP